MSNTATIAIDTPAFTDEPLLTTAEQGEARIQRYIVEGEAAKSQAQPMARSFSSKFEKALRAAQIAKTLHGSAEVRGVLNGPGNKIQKIEAAFKTKTVQSLIVQYQITPQKVAEYKQRVIERAAEIAAVIIAEMISALVG